MNEVKTVGIQGIGSDLASQKSEKRSADAAGKAFDQLLENLKLVENEMDVVLDNPSVHNATDVSNSVHTLGNYIKRIEGIVEKISPENRTKSMTFAISQYEQSKKAEKA